MKRQERCAGERTKFSADGERGGNLRSHSAVGANGRSERGRPQPNRAGPRANMGWDCTCQRWHAVKNRERARKGGAAFNVSEVICHCCAARRYRRCVCAPLHCCRDSPHLSACPFLLSLTLIQFSGKCAVILRDKSFIVLHTDHMSVCCCWLCGRQCPHSRCCCADRNWTWSKQLGRGERETVVVGGNDSLKSSEATLVAGLETSCDSLPASAPAN